VGRQKSGGEKKGEHPTLLSFDDQNAWISTTKKKKGKGSSQVASPLGGGGKGVQDAFYQEEEKKKKKGTVVYKEEGNTELFGKNSTSIAPKREKGKPHLKKHRRGFETLGRLVS